MRTFPHGFVPMGSANCESLSQKSEIFASSLWQGSLWGAQTKAPLVKGGCLGLPRRGDSVAKATDLFTIHSSLFTKKLSLFHIGWYFEEVPTVNPSVTPPACQLPLAREPLGCTDQSPPCQRGVPRLAEAGGFPRRSLGTSYLFPLHYSLKSFPFST